MGLTDTQCRTIEELYHEMFYPLSAYAQSALNDRSLAEEAVQDTFRIACAKADEFLASPNSKGWLLNTLKNVIHNIVTSYDFDVNSAWASFSKNYLPYIQDDKSLYDFDDTEEAGIEQKRGHHKYRPFSRHRLAHVARIAAVVTALLLAGTITASAFGVDLWSAVAKWTRDTFGFSVVTPTENTTAEGEYGSLQEALDNFGAEEDLAPTWIPDGYSLNSVTVSESPTKRVFFALYKNGSEELTIDINDIHNGAGTTLEKDASNVCVYKASGIEHYIMSNIGREKAAWLNGTFECAISGNVSQDELKQMIESIYER